MNHSRIMETIGNLVFIAPDRRISGSGASFLMALFTHVSPDRPSRFSAGQFGVLYIGNNFEVALLEMVHHHARFLARAGESPGWTSQFRELLLDVDASLHDIRGDAAAFAQALLPDDYRPSPVLAAELHAAESDGIVYTSVRCPGGQCVALFYPDLCSDLTQGRHLDYHWNGERVDYYREGSGAMFEIL